ncbi:hypothetical protein LPY66_07470 [Dehalobacter sp. DCM]|uniref:hypothetical protein n=1 Tax=Dehalobacter sp. DCM TaxID=2907827 RepID=UPI003081F5AC|nr:hypothetical protein LPY66_07470 [Dehalobacter sp. DCM]
MAYKTQKRHSFVRTFVFITCIFTLGLSGVSYAYWTNGLEITTKVGTGSLDVSFCDPASDNKEAEENGGLQVTFDQDKTTMTIAGNVDPGFLGTVEYEFANNGSIPVKLAQASETSDIIQNQLSFVEGNQVVSLGDGGYLLKQNGSGTGTIQIEIAESTGSEEESSTTYQFEMKIPYDQWTSN